MSIVHRRPFGEGQISTPAPQEEAPVTTSHRTGTEETFLLNADGSPYYGAYYKTTRVDSLGRVHVQYRRVKYTQRQTIEADGSTKVSVVQEQGDVVHLAQEGDVQNEYVFDNAEAVDQAERDLSERLTEGSFNASDGSFTSNNQKPWNETLVGDPRDWPDVAPSNWTGSEEEYQRYKQRSIENNDTRPPPEEEKDDPEEPQPGDDEAGDGDDGDGDEQDVPGDGAGGDDAGDGDGDDPDRAGDADGPVDGPVDSPDDPAGPVDGPDQDDPAGPVDGPDQDDPAGPVD